MITSPTQQKIVVKQGGKMYWIAIEKISVIKADSNYSTIYFEDKKIMTAKTLKYWADQINHPAFIRCHSKYLINQNMIATIDKTNKILSMCNGIDLPIARRRQVGMMFLTNKNKEFLL